MIYELRHKNRVVLDMEMDEDTGIILKVPSVHNPYHIPLGVGFHHGVLDKKTLNHWLSGRSIPASRQNIEQALIRIGEPSTKRLIAKSYGLSLSDCYWICPKGQALNFEDLNFFQNPFSKDVGELLFGVELEDFSLVSPDNTSDGWLKKRWILRDGLRYLMKGSSGVYNQEPFNEVIASRLCQQMHIPHVDYTVEMLDGKPYSLCENFLSENRELVPAWSIFSHTKRPNDRHPYDHLLHCYEALGVENPRIGLEQMLVLDYLLANTDRHMNNFGLVRDSNTLEVLGLAPIFDSGTALFQSQSSAQFDANIESKPFAKTHEKQIQLVQDVGVYLPENLTEFTAEVATILSQNPFMDDQRRQFVCQQFATRLEQLQEMAQAPAHSMMQKM